MKNTPHCSFYRPIRKYFEYLLSRTASEDVETGGSGGELSSIRVDSSVPSESLTGRSSVSNPQFPKNEQTATPIPQPPGKNTNFGENDELSAQT